jgi:phosphoglycerol transferase MdoB-like AlkP superfamily enzyme
MKQRLIFLLKYYLYWVFIFVFSKILFVFYQYQISKDIPTSALLEAIQKGLIMDVSLSSYILMLTSLILSFCVLMRGKSYSRFLRVINIVLVGLVFLIVVGDLELYRNWGFHVDTTPLLYLKTPKDAFASVSILLITVLLFSIGVLIFVFDYIYKKFIQSYLNKINFGKKYHFLILLFITACMIIPLRGGLKLAPLNPGAVYFHENIFVNHVAINPVWNLMYSLKKVDDLERDYDFMPNDKVKTIVDSLYSESDTYKRVLKHDRPNIVLILMESFSAKTIAALGGIDGVTPNLNKFSKEGILFKHMYACGNRSDKGIPAVLSAYPCHPANSILGYPSKSMNLPCLAKDLDKIGYSTSFYYGGDINFANIRQYVGTGGFKKIVADEDFDTKDNTSKWGVHDHIMFKRFYDDMLKETKPFFKMVFTLSSHEPFDVPMETVIKGNSEGKKYLNSVYYTDKCIGEFIAKCKKTKLWDNTLFIMVADHGSRLPDGDLVSAAISYKIPMIWMGGVLNKDTEPVSTYCSQTDLARTLLCQMNIDNKEYVFSRNLFADKKESFSYYTYNDGVTFLNDSICSIFDNTSQRYIGGNTDKELRGRALLQTFYNDFKNR